MEYKIYYGDSFKSNIGKFTLAERTLIFRKIELLKVLNVENRKSLRTKKLKGSDHWHESSVNMSIRLIWEFGEGEDGNDDIIILEDVGRHDIIKKYA